MSLPFVKMHLVTDVALVLSSGEIGPTCSRHMTLRFSAYRQSFLLANKGGNNHVQSCVVGWESYILGMALRWKRRLPYTLSSGRS